MRPGLDQFKRRQNDPPFLVTDRREGAACDAQRGDRAYYRRLIVMVLHSREWRRKGPSGQQARQQQIKYAAFGEVADLPANGEFRTRH